MSSRPIVVIARLLILTLVVACQASPGGVPPLPAGLVDDPAIDVANLPPPAPAADVKFDHLSLENGLSQSTVTAILQDDQGFMWFGTLDGLNRYDGYTFKVFKHDPTDPATLSDNAISALYQDQAGILWIGTENGGLNRFEVDTETFTNYQHKPEEATSISSNTVRAIAEDRQGTLWIGTQNGLNRYDSR
ncbi:MAG: two-component regulator propeller domain-containing protein, partial [Candidatus Promineifilaceae bacterium]